MDLEEMAVSLLLLCRVIQFAVCRPSGHRSPLDPLPERDADRSQRRFGFAKSVCCIGSISSFASFNSIIFHFKISRINFFKKIQFNFGKFWKIFTRHADAANREKNGKCEIYFRIVFICCYLACWIYSVARGARVRWPCGTHKIYAGDLVIVRTWLTQRFFSSLSIFNLFLRRMQIFIAPIPMSSKWFLKIKFYT